MVALRPGALGTGLSRVQRSGITWLVNDGSQVANGTMIGFCNVAVHAKPGEPIPFLEERNELQAGFILRGRGRLRLYAQPGGDLNVGAQFGLWDADAVLADITPEAGSPDPALELVLYAGRRAVGLAENRSGLMTGWHNRTRTWHAAPGPHSSLLSLGICEQRGIIRGEESTFLDFRRGAPEPSHITFIADDACVPCAATLAEQIGRDEADCRGIVADMTRGLLGGADQPAAADLMVAGAMFDALTAAPMRDDLDVLTRDGMEKSGTPKAILLSLHAERPVVLRHRTLGYTASWHPFRLESAGPAFHAWLKSAFEPVRRGPADILRDYLALADACESIGSPRLLILNMMSSSGAETATCYQPFGAAMGERLATVRAKELNLMLHDLARLRDVRIIDVDAAAASLGGAIHTPDGVHQSAGLQREIREEVLLCLHKQKRLLS